MNYKPTALTTFFFLVFTVIFTRLHAQIDCQEAVEIELIGAGSMGLNAQSILIPNHTTADSIMLEVIAEDNGANPLVTFTVGTETHGTPGKQLIENRNGNIQTGSDRVFQAVFAPAATVSMTIADADAFSFVAYVYRPASNNLAATRSAEVLSTYHDASVQLVQIPAHEETRNLLVTVPVSDLQNDSRIAKITASAGGVSQTLTFSSYDLGLNASLRVANFTLTDVPGNATTLMIRSESPGGGAGGSGNGDSFFTGTAVVATNQCDCGSGFISVEASQVPSIGHAIRQFNTGVSNVQNALGEPVNKYAKIYENSDYLILELQSQIEAGETYEVKWAARTNNSPTMIVSESNDGIHFN